jgi:single-stranded-DNA-specific exonuclease
MSLMTSPAQSETLQPCLEVRQSLLGKAWAMAPCDERLALALAQRHGLHELLARLLALRGVGLDEAERYLNPSLRADMRDPFALVDMDKASARLCDAILHRERVAVFGDYDVDGATSAALLVRFFRALRREVTVYVPDRLREGYGPNVAALKKLHEDGIKLVVTVDCGITAHEALHEARALGLEVIVIDHHKALPELPPARAIVNPNRLDDDSGEGHLAAVGVTFMVLVAVNRLLRARGFYSPSQPEPDLLNWLDLVALGTVCDVVPLKGLNRALVMQGLKVMSRRHNVGLSVLGEVAGLASAPEVYHLGFLLGPRINAGGRVGEADLGVKLLTEEDPARARALAEQLDKHNRERRAIEADMLERAMAEIEALSFSAPETFAAPLVMVAREGFHPGVVGIVAARLVERFDKPALVIGFDEAGVGKGSARSVSGVDIGQAITAAREAGLLVSGGGHAMAAGLSVTRDHIEALRSFLQARLSAPMQARNGAAPLWIDGVLSAGGVEAGLAALIEKAGPFGAGNPQPRFALGFLRLAFAQLVGGAHIRCAFESADGTRLNAVAFRAADTPLGQALLQHIGGRFHLAGKIKRDMFRGKERVELHIEDAQLL